MATGTGFDYRTDEGTQADNRANPAINRGLYNQENAAGSAAGESADTDNGTATRNIDNANGQEKSGGGYKVNVTTPGEGNNGKKAKEPTTFGAEVKKKGPLGLILGSLGIGGFAGTVMLAPGIALVHIKEVIVNKLDKVSSMLETRSNKILKNRMFSTNATCTIKIRCRFSGLTERQMQRLRIQGAELVDANGKPVEKNVLGRYSGGKTLILPDKTPVEAKDFMKTVGENKDLRDLSRSVFAPRWMSFNDKISKAIRAQDKLVTNATWGEGDEKTANQNVAKATAGESYTAEAQAPSTQDQYTTDSNGNQVKKEANQVNLDLGDLTTDVNKEATKDANIAQTGNFNELTDLPTEVSGAAMMPETPGSVSLGKKIVGFFNPTDLLVGLCGTYKIANAIDIAARTVALLSAMRLASQFLSTADKIKAGDGTSGEAEAAMNMMEKPDRYGDAFGDSVTYQYSTYGTIPDKQLTSTALGTGVVVVLAAAIHWVNKHIGKEIIKNGCNFLSNPLTQGALALTSFIPGGGEIVGAIKTAISTSAKAIADKTIQDTIKSLVKAAAQKVTSNVTKDALKSAAKTATKEFLKVAASAGGIFLASYLTERYAIPYLGRVLSNTLFPTDGVNTIDTMGNGTDAIFQSTAQARGAAPLTPTQASAYNAFNDASTATYIADMRSESNPLDLYNPYSASNSLASTFYTFTSQIKNSGLLAAPAAIFSSLHLGSLFGGQTALAASEGVYPDCQQDDFISSTGLATSPYCNIMMGSNDLGMLQNEDPDELTQWMIGQHQIDGNGDPIPKSDYETFKAECPVTDRQFLDIGDPEKQINPDCYNLSKVNSDNWKHFYIYTVDLSVTDAMDNDQASTSSTPSNAGPVYIAAGNIPASGMVVGASVFGGTLTNGQWVQNLADNGGNDLGDHGNSMTGVPAFAELANGKALGGVPDGTRLEISYNGKSVIAVKEDIGAGGPDVNGHTRAIDLWWQTANLLGLQDGTASVTIHAVDPATPLSTVASTGNPNLKNISFSLGQILSDYRPFMSYARGAY